MAQITLNEGLAWLKTLKKRKEPVYDVRALDKSVTRVAREIRLLEQALKAANVKTVVEAYDQDDAALGESTSAERSSTRRKLWGSRGGVRSLVGAGP